MLKRGLLYKNADVMMCAVTYLPNEMLWSILHPMLLCVGDSAR